MILTAEQWAPIIDAIGREQVSNPMFERLRPVIESLVDGAYQAGRASVEQAVEQECAELAVEVIRLATLNLRVQSRVVGVLPDGRLVSYGPVKHLDDPSPAWTIRFGASDVPPVVS